MQYNAIQAEVWDVWGRATSSKRAKRTFCEAKPLLETRVASKHMYSTCMLCLIIDDTLSVCREFNSESRPGLRYCVLTCTGLSSHQKASSHFELIIVSCSFQPHTVISTPQIPNRRHRTLTIHSQVPRAASRKSRRPSLLLKYFANSAADDNIS